LARPQAEKRFKISEAEAEAQALLSHLRGRASNGQVVVACSHRRRRAGVKIAISTDAHSTSGFANMRFGVDQARRGWLETDDVINTLPLALLQKLLKRSRSLRF
jgi:histidinol phosphatase-like PHP family hydrolase